MGSTVTTRGIYIKDSISAYLPDQNITASWSKAVEWWELAAENPWWMGGFIWTASIIAANPLLTNGRT